MDSHLTLIFQFALLLILLMYCLYFVDFRSQWSVKRFAVMSLGDAKSHKSLWSRYDCSCYKIIVITILLSTFNIASTAAAATTKSYRFLGIFPHPAVSHFRAFEPLLVELSLRGHDVYVVSHFPNKNAPPPANYHDFPLDQSDIMTSTAPVDEVSAKNIVN